MAQLETRLRTCNICNLTVQELDVKERKQCERYFRDYVLPILSPQVVDAHHPFPHLPSKTLNIAVSLKRDGESCFGIVPIPKSVPAYLKLNERGLRYVLIEQLVLEYVGDIFDQYAVESKAVISVTRNADISPEDEITTSTTTTASTCARSSKSAPGWPPSAWKSRGTPATPWCPTCWSACI